MSNKLTVLLTVKATDRILVNHLSHENGLKLDELPLEAFTRVNAKTSLLDVFVGIIEGAHFLSHYIGNDQTSTSRYATETMNEDSAII